MLLPAAYKLNTVVEPYEAHRCFLWSKYRIMDYPTWKREAIFNPGETAEYIH
jgi:hypothetical protein